MKSSILDSQVTKVLEELYTDAYQNDQKNREALMSSGVSFPNERARYKALTKVYMPVNPEFGNLIYAMARGMRAKTIVEFGTSFGVSTIFLAAALRDLGEGKVITTEFVPEKAEQARKNLARAGLEKWVDFRVGDAVDELKNNLSSEVDFVFLDGAKTLYLDVLRVLEPRLKTGALIASDNTDHEGIETFLEYIQNPKYGYVSSAILTVNQGYSKGHEVSIRL